MIDMIMKKNLQLSLLIFFIVLFFSLLCLSGCADTNQSLPVTRTGFAFDTVITITIYDEQKSYVLEECFARCDMYERLFSTTLENSDVWNINHSHTEPVTISYDTACLLQSALFYCMETDGLLDITLFPIIEEWHISKQMTYHSENADYEYYIPSSDQLTQLLSHVNYKNVLLLDHMGREVGYTDSLSSDVEYSVVLLDPYASIDLGFLAKGYIADALKQYLMSEGIENGIISLGGNVLLIGSKPDSTSYHVGIQKPFGGRNELITTVEGSDISIVSSGCYERYFILDESKKDGTIYHHIFDTTTGYPVQNDLLSVTILSDSSLQGDALSTYCYILGLEKGLDYIASCDKVDAVFVTTEYQVHYQQ